MRRLAAVLLVCTALGPLRADAQSADMGDTFHRLEREATRVTTWFADTFAVSERGTDGTLRTRLHDRKTSALIASLEYEEGGPGNAARLAGEVEAVPIAIEQAVAPRRTADWLNRQIRQFWLDGKARGAAGRRGPPAFVDEGGLWRMAVVMGDRRSAPPATGEDAVESVATEFPEGVAVAEKDRHDGPAGRKTARSTFTSRMAGKDGREVGFVRWFAEDRVLTWSFPNGRKGVAQESKVPGGFKFTPTLAWANVQALAFLRQSQQPAVKVPVPAMDPPPAGPEVAVDPLAPRGPSAPEISFQDAGCNGVADGCTGLHFLDGTIFEECCTRHDLCYERNHPTDCCEAWSWFVPLPWWHCARCNFSAVWCFITRPGPEPDRDGPPLGECERQSYADWCPPECATCMTREAFGDGRD